MGDPFDPFSELKEAVEPVFLHVQPRSNGKYTYSEIQELKDAIENYQPNKKATFIELANKLSAALPLFEGWQINFQPIKNAIDSLAAKHQMPPFDFAHPKVSPRFQFGDSQKEIELIPWLDTLLDKTFTLEEPSLHSQLIAGTSESGFTQKLNSHLDKDPEFLSRLIMESKEHFFDIAESKLIFHLTDEDIAKAIIKYLPVLAQENPSVPLKQLMDGLNEKLYRRPIPMLLRSDKAKAILESSELFQTYQETRQEHPSFAENVSSKPR
ncbi:Uncharacterised protein [Legionella steigerwaltii]|uniref:Uncharacterized protein n=1 Tax=Legionella steigerwaltii TaxID=460 RepID=A0A378LIR2_9GAMM|nr:hypothetical protein [Legionella steigerwaltii]KTD70248.1 hypothetical protein Lstg_3250 [Legionella steigerwaltii]STY23981.1 Uncharacterised protein [Legionella steigerwaltii]